MSNQFNVLRSRKTLNLERIYAEGRTRTDTILADPRILSPVRLPISPPRHAARTTLHAQRIQEAARGFEPRNKGFADLCLTTWLRRREFITEGTENTEKPFEFFSVCSVFSVLKN